MVIRLIQIDQYTYIYSGQGIPLRESVFGMFKDSGLGKGGGGGRMRNGNGQTKCDSGKQRYEILIK